MLPSKGYFNSLECPFYMSSTKCFRPYCHFKHPKRDISAENLEAKANAKEEGLANVKPQLPLPTITEPPPAPVKHIPIAYIPSKPSAISVNTKKPKSVYVPNVKNDANSKNILGPVDYDPLSIMDTVEKTYSRYSYEKQDYDSEDELFKPLFNNSKKTVSDMNDMGKSEDGSKSGDDETDDYPDGAEFSPPISPKDEDEGMEFKEEFTEAEETPDVKPKLSPIKKKSDLTENADKEIKCKKKRKYNELDTKTNDDHKMKSQNVAFDKISTRSEENENCNVASPKKIKIEGESNHVNERKTEKKVCKRKRTADGVKQALEEDDKQSLDSKKHSSSSKRHEKNVPTNKHSSKSHSSDHKSSDAGKKTSSSDSKKSSSEKKHSSSNHKNTDIKKHESKSSEGSKKPSSTDKHTSKHHSSENKLSSSDNKYHTSKTKHQSSNDKHHSSSEHKHHSSDSKHHASGKHRSSSDSKKLKLTDDKSKENKNKDNCSSRTSIKDNKNKTNERKLEDKNKKHTEKKKEHISKIKSLTKHSSSSKDGKIKSDRSRDSSSCEKLKGKSSSKRKNFEVFDGSESDNDRKETILISDSSNNEESDNNSKRYDSPVDIDDIIGSSSDSDRGGGINHHNMSESENEEEYTPKPLHSSKAHSGPVYTPASKEYLEEMRQKFKLTQSAPTEDYKPVQTVSKVRIAHVPNVSSLISAKHLINSGRTVPPALQKIVTATHVINNPRVQSRTLVHNASTSKPRPQITTNLDSVIALSIRQPGLNNIFDEFLKFVSYDEAYRRAVEEETDICNIATNPQSYRNRIALCILRIRKSKGAADVVKKEKVTSNSKPDYTYGLTLYECFSKYLLKHEDFVLHGFPLELPGKAGCVYIDKNSYFRNKHTGPREGPFRKCCNCGQEYAIDEETEMPLTMNDCYHHWGKPIGMGRLGKIYTCCKAEVGSEPCHISLYHVTETKNDDCLEGFVRTRPYPPDADPNKAGIYAMDCEMCFTTKGRDIVRVSLLSIDNESVYDVLIKPKYPVLDYCTRFSGITEEKLVNVTTTLEEVQKFVLKMVNDKTILVGHSLENDLKALKLIHYTVVDTSLMFPHKEGLPVKCALRTLTSRILGQAIQTGENGHDSLEDARASLQLVLHQVKEDAKSRKPRVVKQLKSK